jgi:hypothetical protein
MKGSARAFAVFTVPCALTACIAPFSEMQGARMVGPGAVEVTPFYSAVSFSAEGESEKIQDHFGAHLAFGLSPKTDLRFRLERVAVSDADAEVTVIAGGPKFSLSQDRAAVYLPVGIATGSGVDESETLSFHPTLLFTLPVSRSVELNPSVKALVPISSEEGDVMWAANLGLAIGPNVRKWAIRPEFGILKNPGDEGTAFHWTIGFSFGSGR